MIEIIINYSKNKIQEDIELFKKLIDCIYNG